MAHARVRLLAAGGAAVVILAAVIGVSLRPASANDEGVISMQPGDRKVITVTRPMGSSGEGVAGSAAPNDCRNDPQISLVCDTYRVKLALDPSPDALNFVRFELNFDTLRAPCSWLAGASRAGSR